MPTNAVTILGSQWKIIMGTAKEYPYLKNVGGFCDESVREIVVRKQRDTPKPKQQMDLREYERSCLRHEIVHAFMYESGLANSAKESPCWAMNEEMIDWIARQHEKIHAAYLEAGAIIPDNRAR